MSNDRQAPGMSGALIAAAAVLAALLGLPACGDDDDSESSDPTVVVEGYVAAYNSGDADAVVAFYSEDAVITGHPFSGRTEGSTAIRTLMVRDIAASDQSGESYRISNVQVTDNTVTWDHVWNGGSVCSGTGNEAVIEDGEIATYAFAASVECE